MSSQPRSSQSSLPSHDLRYEAQLCSEYPNVEPVHTHTRREQHELWLSQFMTVALKGDVACSWRITGGTDDETLWERNIILIISHEKTIQI